MTVWRSNQLLQSPENVRYEPPVGLPDCKLILVLVFLMISSCIKFSLLRLALQHLQQKAKGEDFTNLLVLNSV